VSFFSAALSDVRVRTIKCVPEPALACRIQVVCDGHGFMRNLRDGFYRLGEPTGDPRIPHAPRLARAWDDLTQILAAA